jgi:hypothetical protein
MSDEETLERIFELLGKQKPIKFDPVKRLEQLLMNRDFWKEKWASQHTATGLSYWVGYTNGFNDRTHGKKAKMEMLLRSESVFKQLTE